MTTDRVDTRARSEPNDGRRFNMRRVKGVLFLSSTMVLLATTAAYAAVPEKVLDDPRLDERSAAASPDYFAWSQNLPSNSNLFNSYVRPSGGGPRVRVNPAGTRS